MQFCRKTPLKMFESNIFDGFHPQSAASPEPSEKAGGRTQREAGGGRERRRWRTLLLFVCRGTHLHSAEVLLMLKASLSERVTSCQCSQHPHCFQPHPAATLLWICILEKKVQFLKLMQLRDQTRNSWDVCWSHTEPYGGETETLITVDSSAGLNFGNDTK